MAQKKNQELPLEKKKKAIYSRKSKWTGKGESIENQITMCKQKLCMQYSNISVEEDILVYEDEGYSGGNLIRPKFTEMMADIRAGKIDMVMCYRLDRISRNVSDFSGLITELNRLGVSFASATEPFDTTTPIGRAMMVIVSVFAELERDTIAERIRDNMHELAKTGRWLGGKLPLGYTSEKVFTQSVDGKTLTSHKLTVQEDEAALTQMIFAKFLEVQSLTKTETFLINNNYRTKKGNEFSRFAIKNILSNPVYLIADEDAYTYLKERNVELCAAREAFDGVHGIAAYNRTEQTPHKATKMNPMEEWIVTVGRHKGLISGAEWVKVQALLDENKGKSYRYRSVRTNCALLSGVLYCGCGAFMRPKVTNRVNAHGDRVYTYSCERKEKSRGDKCSSRPLDGNYLDRWICEVLKSLSEDGSQFRKDLAKSKSMFTENRTTYEKELEQVGKSLKTNSDEIQSLTSQLARAFENGIGDELMAEIKKRKEKGEELSRRLKELEELTDTYVLTANQFDVFLSALSTFAGTVDNMTVEEKRAAIRMIVRKLVWDGKKVHVYLLGTEDDGEEGGMDFPPPPDDENPDFAPPDGMGGDAQGEKVSTCEDRK